MLALMFAMLSKLVIIDRCLHILADLVRMAINVTSS